MSDLLLIVNEPQRILEKLCAAFPAAEYQVEVAASGIDGLARVAGAPVDVVLLELELRDQSGLEILKRIRAIDFRTSVIVITQARSADSFIEVMRHGAHDYLIEPLDPQKLARVTGKALKVARLVRAQADFEETPAGDDVSDELIVGCCPKMQEVYKAIGRVADQNFPVLIIGESGTGKELVARAIYKHGTRSKSPFLALNCAAIPENLLESEFFGHEKGAFTGADQRRLGKFEYCHGGSIFLDEICDMPLSLQAKVLRLIQEQAFERVGGAETIRTDVRLIAATNRDLKQCAKQGTFRPDLYYRLGVFSIHLPALRDRGDDLPLLVNCFVGRFSRELGRDVRHVSEEALACLRRYSWPGNIRELQSVLKQALLHSRGAVLLPEFLPELPGVRGQVQVTPPAEEEPGMATFQIRQRIGIDADDLYAESHRELDRILLPRIMKQTRGNLRQSALLLGIARKTLRMKLIGLGLSERRPFKAANDDRVARRLVGA